MRAVAVVAGLAENIATRELARLSRHFERLDTQIRRCRGNEGPGNVLMMRMNFPHTSELFTCFGERGVSAETIADRLSTQVQRFLLSGAPVGEYLADQLVLPMALAGAGSFTTSDRSSHLETNLAVIEAFLPVESSLVTTGQQTRVAITPRASTRLQRPHATSTR
jgi:RNA 3'-terminal phosphate cyclase (ATP)